MPDYADGFTPTFGHNSATTLLSHIDFLTVQTRRPRQVMQCANLTHCARGINAIKSASIFSMLSVFVFCTAVSAIRRANRDTCACPSAPRSAWGMQSLWDTTVRFAYRAPTNRKRSRLQMPAPPSITRYR